MLLKKVDSAILSTVGIDGLPNASYAPVAYDDDNNIYIYISDLSRHTKNLIDTCKVSIMFIEDESMADNIFARKRLTINVDAELIERKTEKWYEKINFLEDNFGETIKYLKEMNDFHLFRLIPKDALLVYGFGKAFRFTGKKLNQLKHLNDEGHKREKTT